MNLNRHCNWTQFWHLLRCSAWTLLNLILSGVKYEQQCSCVTIFPSSVKRSDPKYRLIICIAFENRYFPKLFPNTNCFLCTRPETILILKSWIENEGNVRNLKQRSEELKHREPGLWSPLWATQCPPLVSHTSCIQSSDNTTRDKFIYYTGVHCAIPFWNINDQCNIRSAEVDAFQSIDSFQCSTNTLTSWKIWYKIMQHNSVECRVSD